MRITDPVYTPDVPEYQQIPESQYVHEDIVSANDSSHFMPINETKTIEMNPINDQLIKNLEFVGKKLNSSIDAINEKIQPVFNVDNALAQKQDSFEFIQSLYCRAHGFYRHHRGNHGSDYGSDYKGIIQKPLDMTLEETIVMNSIILTVVMIFSMCTTVFWIIVIQGIYIFFINNTIKAQTKLEDHFMGPELNQAQPTGAQPTQNAIVYVSAPQIQSEQMPTGTIHPRSNFII